MRIDFKKKYKINSLKLKIVLSIMLFIIYSRWLGKMPSPYFTDEVGYWGCAAFFAGIDWTSVTSKLAYYGYGYGIFLFPLFLLGDSKLIYEGARILNIIFIECVFWMLERILNRIFTRKYEVENIICAFVGCLYSAFIIYSHLAMVETCILFFLVLLVMLVQMYCDKTKILYGVLIAVVLFELVAIHLRNLIFVAITFIFLLLIMVAKKKDIRNVAITLSIICSAVILALIGKKYITEAVYTDVVTKAHIDVNDNIAGRLWFVHQLFNINWWKNYFINVLCKSFYIILSSMFTVIFAVIGIVKNCKTSGNISNKLFDYFLLLLLISSVLYASLVMYAGGENFRIDILFYGRYIECIMPIFCAVGLDYSFRLEKSLKYDRVHLISVAAVLAISFVAFSYYRDNNVSMAYSNIMPFQISCFSWILKDKPENITQMITLLAVLAYVFIGVIMYITGKKNRYLSLAIVAVFWIASAYTGWNAFGLNLNETTDTTTLSRVQRMEKINEAADYVKKLECDEVYYIFNPDSVAPDFFDMFTLQFDLLKVKLLPISGDEIQHLPDGSIIAVNYCSDYYGYVSSRNELVYKNDLFIVARGCDSEEE